MTRDHDYEAAADWAENKMTLKRNSGTALRGAAAAEHGRAALARATGGRPSIDPDAGVGQHSPRRQVRLATTVDRQLQVVAASQHRSVSAVLRDAVAEYLSTHPIGSPQA